MEKPSALEVGGFVFQPLSLADARQSSTLCRLRDISLRPEGVFPNKGSPWQNRKLYLYARASPTRGGGIAQAMTERLYREKAALRKQDVFLHCKMPKKYLEILADKSKKMSTQEA